MDIILNQVIGAVIGAIVSIAISWYFYKKADLPAQVANEMIDNILFINIQDRLGEQFLFYDYPHEIQLPKDQDTPHVAQFWYSTNAPKQGESVLILFRVVDTGRNFGGSQFIEVTDTASMLSFPVARQGHGYYAVKIDFADNALTGQHTITFKLTDRKRKSYTQSLKINLRGLEEDTPSFDFTDKPSKHDERLARIRAEYPKAYEKWTDEEDNSLKQKFGEGVTTEELARIFQRQPSAIRSRLTRLGMVAERNESQARE